MCYARGRMDHVGARARARTRACKRKKFEKVHVWRHEDSPPVDRQNDRRTGLKTLPSRKLRMRTVIIDKYTENDLLREIMSLASLCETKSSTS